MATVPGTAHGAHTAASVQDHREAGAARGRPRIAAAQRERPETQLAALELAGQHRAVDAVDETHGLPAAGVQERRVRARQELLWGSLRTNKVLSSAETGKWPGHWGA